MFMRNRVDKWIKTNKEQVEVLLADMKLPWHKRKMYAILLSLNISTNLYCSPTAHVDIIKYRVPNAKQIFTCVGMQHLKFIDKLYGFDRNAAKIPVVSSTI